MMTNRLALLAEFISAARDGDLKTVKSLWEEFGSTTLTLELINTIPTCQRTQSTALPLPLTVTQQVSTANTSHKTALSYAIEGLHVGVVEYLVAICGVNIYPFAALLDVAKKLKNKMGSFFDEGPRFDIGGGVNLFEILRNEEQKSESRALPIGQMGCPIQEAFSALNVALREADPGLRMGRAPAVSPEGKVPSSAVFTRIFSKAYAILWILLVHGGRGCFVCSNINTTDDNTEREKLCINSVPIRYQRSLRPPLPEELGFALEWACEEVHEDYPYRVTRLLLEAISPGCLPFLRLLLEGPADGVVGGENSIRETSGRLRGFWAAQLLRGDEARHFFEGIWRNQICLNEDRIARLREKFYGSGGNPSENENASQVGRANIPSSELMRVTTESLRLTKRHSITYDLLEKALSTRDLHILGYLTQGCRHFSLQSSMGVAFDGMPLAIFSQLSLESRPVIGLDITLPSCLANSAFELTESSIERASGDCKGDSTAEEPQQPHRSLLEMAVAAGNPNALASLRYFFTLFPNWDTFDRDALCFRDLQRKSDGEYMLESLPFSFRQKSLDVGDLQKGKSPQIKGRTSLLHQFAQIGGCHQIMKKSVAEEAPQVGKDCGNTMFFSQILPEDTCSELHSIDANDLFRQHHLVDLPSGSDMLRAFLSEGADLNIKTSSRHPAFLSGEEEGGNGRLDGSYVTPLFVAKCPISVQLLLDHGADVDELSLPHAARDPALLQKPIGFSAAINQQNFCTFYRLICFPNGPPAPALFVPPPPMHMFESERLGETRLLGQSPLTAAEDGDGGTGMRVVSGSPLDEKMFDAIASKVVEGCSLVSRDETQEELGHHTILRLVGAFAESDEALAIRNFEPLNEVDASDIMLSTLGNFASFYSVRSGATPLLLLTKTRGDASLYRFLREQAIGASPSTSRSPGTTQFDNQIKGSILLGVISQTPDRSCAYAPVPLLSVVQRAMALNPENHPAVVEGRLYAFEVDFLGRTVLHYAASSSHNIAKLSARVRSGYIPAVQRATYRVSGNAAAYDAQQSSENDLNGDRSLRVTQTSERSLLDPKSLLAFLICPQTGCKTARCIPTDKDINGRTGLHAAVLSNGAHNEVLRALVLQGWSLNEPDNEGMTPLMLYMSRKFPSDILTFLCDIVGVSKALFEEKSAAFAKAKGLIEAGHFGMRGFGGFGGFPASIGGGIQLPVHVASSHGGKPDEQSFPTPYSDYFVPNSENPSDCTCPEKKSGGKMRNPFHDSTLLNLQYVNSMSAIPCRVEFNSLNFLMDWHNGTKIHSDMELLELASIYGGFSGKNDSTLVKREDSSQTSNEIKPAAITRRLLALTPGALPYSHLHSLVGVDHNSFLWIRNGRDLVLLFGLIALRVIELKVQWLESSDCREQVTSSPPKWIFDIRDLDGFTPQEYAETRYSHKKEMEGVSQAGFMSQFCPPVPTEATVLSAQSSGVVEASNSPRSPQGKVCAAVDSELRPLYDGLVSRWLMKGGGKQK